MQHPSALHLRTVRVLAFASILTSAAFGCGHPTASVGSGGSNGSGSGGSNGSASGGSNGSASGGSTGSASGGSSGSASGGSNGSGSGGSDHRPGKPAREQRPGVGPAHPLIRRAVGPIPTFRAVAGDNFSAMTTAQPERAVRDEILSVDAELAELRRVSAQLRSEIGRRDDGATDPEDLAAAITSVEEQEALIGVLEARRERLLARLPK